MAAGMVQGYAPFTAKFDEVAEAVLAAGGPSIRDFPGWEPADPAFHDTEVVQSLLLATQLSLLHAFDQRGLRPHVLIGHSVGEFAAATHAGFSRWKTPQSAGGTRAAHERSRAGRHDLGPPA